jgi:hypothetical protein
MDKNSIKNLLDNTFLNEAKVPGLDITNKAKSESGKQNKKAIKDIEGKLSNYDKESKDIAKDSINPVKFNYNSDSEEEYHQEMEIMNGQEVIQYDTTPNDKFKKRAEEAIVGSSNMGNNPEWANVVAKGQGGDPDFGKKLVKAIKSSQKKRNNQTPTSKMFGDDWEVVEDQGHKPYAFENKENNKKTIKESNKMKRLTFKKPFNGVYNALNLIPESYKVDNKIFELSDGNESYRVRWEGSLNEGKAVVLMAADKTLVNEDMQKMKHLMGYKSHETFGTLKGSERLNEDKKFGEIWNKTKSLLTEDLDEELHGNQDEIDADGDGNITSKDFEILRGKKNEGIYEMDDTSNQSTTTNQSTIKKTALEVIKNDVPKMTPAEKESFEEIVVKLGELFSTGGNQDTGMFKTVKEKMLTMVDDVTTKKGQQTPTNEDLSPEEEMPEAPSHEETDANQVYEMDRFDEVFDGMGYGDDIESENMEESFLDIIKKGFGKIGGMDNSLEKAIKTQVGKELYDSYMNSTDEKEWFNKNKSKLVGATKVGGDFDSLSGSSIQPKDFVEFLRKKKSELSNA